MKKKYLDLINKLSVNRSGRIGVILITTSFISFLILELARFAGILTNAYIGLITYLLFPLLFMVGLVLIPISWQQLKKSTGKSNKELIQHQFGPHDTASGFFGSRVFKSVATLTMINVLFLILASSQMLHFMEGAEFCGTACHSVMGPEWKSYQQSPHARVKCVECHVGEGTKALLASKLNGAYQMLSVTFNLYEKPIPTPVHQLRPARETCEKCHWPDKFIGDRLKSYVRFERDEQNTPRYTSLNLKIDQSSNMDKPGIHWHIAKDNEVRYTSVNDNRRKMIWVEMTNADGSLTRFENRNMHSYEIKTVTGPREMDCVDCHNRATHIYEDPAQAIDLRMHKGLIDRHLPFIKREGLIAISKGYNTKQAGLAGIRKHISAFYEKNYPAADSLTSQKIEQAITTLQNIYDRNVHPSMKVRWGSYPNFIGHHNNSGCFRCHNQNMVSKDGQTISHDCVTCHSILAQEEDVPFKYLNPPDMNDKSYEKHVYLQKEFMSSVSATTKQE